jgi:uncharacterized protein (DUF983 family)
MSVKKCPHCGKCFFEVTINKTCTFCGKDLDVDWSSYFTDVFNNDLFGKK